MDVKTKTVEQFLFEQLEKIAPGKYGLADVVQLFKSKLRFPCTHLKGRHTPGGLRRDYNLSIFTFPTGVTEVKCLYNCGLKVRSDDKELTSAFNQLYDFPTSNTPASAEVRRTFMGGVEVPIDAGPPPTYSDAERQRIKESNDVFLRFLQKGVEEGHIKTDNPVLGGTFPHPDPIEEPRSIVERGVKEAFVKSKQKKVLNTAVSFHDASIPALKPVKRKTQSRKRGKKSTQ